VIGRRGFWLVAAPHPSYSGLAPRSLPHYPPFPPTSQYTALGRYADPNFLCVCFDDKAVNRANTRELEFFAAKAAETAKELLGHTLQQLVVVRNVTGFLASRFGASDMAGPGRGLQRPHVAQHGYSDYGFDDDT